jgi:protein-S-isoprenylcysteine O-methyltransferase Ste14
LDINHFWGGLPLDTTTRINPLLRIPPPLLFVLTFFAGVGLQRLIPLRIYSANVLRIGHTVGIGMVGIGVLLALSCVGTFLLARTTLNPFGTAANIITGGAYRFTRNPMYVSLVIVYLGVVGIQGQLWPLLLLPLPVTLIHRKVIPFEEARMRQVFGESYENYCASVRRWL